MTSAHPNLLLAYGPALLLLVAAFLLHRRARLLAHMFVGPVWFFCVGLALYDIYPPNGQVALALHFMLSNPLTYAWPFVVVAIYWLIARIRSRKRRAAPSGPVQHPPVSPGDPYTAQVGRMTAAEAEPPRKAPETYG